MERCKREMMVWLISAVFGSHGGLCGEKACVDGRFHALNKTPKRISKLFITKFVRSTKPYNCWKGEKRERGSSAHCENTPFSAHRRREGVLAWPALLEECATCLAIGLIRGRLETLERHQVTSHLIALGHHVSIIAPHSNLCLI